MSSQLTDLLRRTWYSAAEKRAYMAGFKFAENKVFEAMEIHKEKLREPDDDPAKFYYANGIVMGMAMARDVLFNFRTKAAKKEDTCIKNQS